jgi:hypothetical protein
MQGLHPEEEEMNENVSRRVDRKGRPFFLLFLSFIALFGLSAEAGIIYGWVKGAGFTGGDSLVVVRDDNNSYVKNIHTDKNGEYRLFIRPGIYRVELKDGNHTVGRGFLQSYDRAMHVDIHLQETE